MGYQNPPLADGDRERFGIGRIQRTGGPGGLEIQRRLATEKADEDLGVEIFAGMNTGPRLRPGRSRAPGGFHVGG